MRFTIGVVAILALLPGCSDTAAQKMQKDIGAFFAHLGGPKGQADAPRRGTAPVGTSPLPVEDLATQLRARVAAGEITEAEAVALLRNASMNAPLPAPTPVLELGPTRIIEIEDQRNAGETDLTVGTGRLSPGGQEPAPSEPNVGL